MTLRPYALGPALLLALFPLAAGCAPAKAPLGPDSIASDNPAVEKKFRDARASFDKGALDDADKAFAALAAESPDDPLARAAAIYRARIAMAKKDPARARKLLSKVAGGSDPIAERAAFYDGLALFQLGAYPFAVKRLAPFAGRMTDAAENLVLLETLWKAANFSGDKADAILWLDAYLAHVPEGADREIAVKTQEALCAEIGDTEALAALAEKLDSDRNAWPLVMARRAALHFDAEEFPQAKAILDEVEKKGRAESPAVQEIAMRIEQRETVDLYTVGLMVPLAGRSRLVGESVVRGAMLGAKAVPLGNGRQGLAVVIRDVQDDPAAAAKAVEDLVYSDHVAAIVGPIDTAPCEAAVARAEALGVPVLPLSLSEKITQTGPFVFRHFATNAYEVRALLAASKRSGAASVFALYPDNGYGRAMRAILGKEVEAAGMALAGEREYPAGETAFVALATELAEKEFDAIFIPDSAAQIALIAPALAAAGLWPTAPGKEPAGPGRPVQLLVTSTGLAPDLLRRAGRYLDGALFAGFFHKDASAAAAEFATRFRTAYGTDPNALAAFGYDALVLLASAVRDGAASRAAIRDWLAQAPGKGGPALTTPFSGFSGAREPLALPMVLEVGGGELKVLK